MWAFYLIDKDSEIYLFLSLNQSIWERPEGSVQYIVIDIMLAASHLHDFYSKCFTDYWPIM